MTEKCPVWKSTTFVDMMIFGAILIALFLFHFRIQDLVDRVQQIELPRIEVEKAVENCKSIGGVVDKIFVKNGKIHVDCTTTDQDADLSKLTNE